MIEWSHKQIQITDDLFFAYLASRDLLCPHEKCFLWGHNKFLLVGQTGSLRNVTFRFNRALVVILYYVTSAQSIFGATFLTNDRFLYLPARFLSLLSLDCRNVDHILEFGDKMNLDSLQEGFIPDAATLSRSILPFAVRLIVDSSKAIGLPTSQTRTHTRTTLAKNKTYQLTLARTKDILAETLGTKTEGQNWSIKYNSEHP